VLAETYRYDGETLLCEQTALADIARRVGTPVYVYSAEAIRSRFCRYRDALGGPPGSVCYAVKANSNLAILALLAAEGAGFDIVSGGELFRVIAAGGDPSRVVFSGVGKTREEIDYALSQGVACFNCESWDEMALIDSLAQRLGKRPRVAFRVNPDVDARTHRHISTGKKINKFGVDIDRALDYYGRAGGLRSVEVSGVSCHIGSQIFETDQLLAAADRVLALADRLRASGLGIRHLDMGGGLGVAYRAEERTPSIEDLIGALRDKAAGRGYSLQVEPGRSIVAEAGVMLTRVLYRKDGGAKNFVVVDASMAELIRPVLYEAWHEIVPLRRAARPPLKADIVGPVCESGDFLAEDRDMPMVFPGDLLAVCTAGAYGFVQACNYNSRPRPAEVLVDGASFRVVRERETWDDLIRGERP